MIIIEALNINSGGGAILLNYFIRILIYKKIAFFALLDKRWGHQISELNDSNSIAYENAVINRRKIITRFINRQENIVSLFCFGNYPAGFSIKKKIRVVTFFQNYHLLEGKSLVGIKLKLSYFLRRLYLRLNRNSTDYYIFQSCLVLDKFKQVYNPNEHVILKEMLFFDDKEVAEIKNKFNLKVKNKFIYPSLPHGHKNLERLLDTWERLLQQNKTPQLFLTIPDSDFQNLHKRIAELNLKGARITNLGLLSHEALLTEVSTSEFCIYPSLLETVGLGLIEAAMLDTKVIAADLPYTHSIVKPSLVFDPYSVQSMVIAVNKAISEPNLLNQTTLKVKNSIEDLLILLTTSNA